jgi:aminoglycoside 2'-N-acetyltransferase I
MILGRPFAIEVLDSRSISARSLAQVRALCTEAYAEDFTEILAQLGPGVHVLGWMDSLLVSHAMWVTRWLEPAGRAPLRTAYVEAVATKPAYQRRGLASELLARLAREIGDYDLGGLSPSDAGFYARLGWEPWRGPLSIRKGDATIATPEEEVMILRLPRTPPDLDLEAPLSAEWRAGELW